MMSRIPPWVLLCTLLGAATAGWAQGGASPSTLYVWREAGGTKYSNIAPRWYESGRGGPPIQVFRNNTLIDDTSWPASKRASTSAAPEVTERTVAAREEVSQDQRETAKPETAKPMAAKPAPGRAEQQAAPRGAKLLADNRVEVLDGPFTDQELGELCNLIPAPSRGPNLAGRCDTRRIAQEARARELDKAAPRQ